MTADWSDTVEVTIRIPRESAEYAVRIMQGQDATGSVDLIRLDGSKGADWSAFEVIARASVLEVIASEQDKRDPRQMTMRKRELEETCPSCPLRHGQRV